MKFVKQPAESAVPVALVALVNRIRAGERSAEDELVHRYERGVAIIIRQITRDSVLTDDLCQETFRLVLEKMRRGDLREAERLSGFVCSVARNLTLDYLRRTRRMESLEGLKGDAAIALSDPAPGPLDQLLEDEKTRAVRQVLAELSTGRDREILYRFYLSEEDKDGICSDLGLSNLHFNRVLYRARRRFKELYEQKIV